MGRGVASDVWQLLMRRRSRQAGSTLKPAKRAAAELTGSQFVAPGTDGDFTWMIEQPQYADALFIFNDNEEQFRAFIEDPAGEFGCARGGGNAAIRPYRRPVPPRAAGIPTGADGAGYTELNDSVREVIDESFSVIRELLASGRYRKVIYSAADENGTLGTGIFEVADDVKSYIVAGLHTLAD